MKQVNSTENRREFFRHDFVTPMCAKMKICKIQEKKVDTKPSPVCIYDIGAGGLRFQTNLQLPVRKDVVLSFEMRIAEVEYEAFGKIIRSNQLDNGYFEYGIRFLFNEEERQKELFNLLNKMLIQLRRNTSNSGCSVCSLNTECYKSILEKEKANYPVY